MPDKNPLRISVPEEILNVTFRGQSVVLRHADILYIDSSNHVLRFHMRDGQEYTSYGRLDEMQTQLASKLFVRCTLPMHFADSRLTIATAHEYEPSMPKKFCPLTRRSPNY